MNNFRLTSFGLILQLRRFTASDDVLRHGASYSKIFALPSITGFPGHITLQVYKRILLTNWTSWKGVRSWYEQKRTIWLVLQNNITIRCIIGLVVWDGCHNADLLHSLEVLNRRAARTICNLPRDMPTERVYRHSNWNTLINLLL